MKILSTKGKTLAIQTKLIEIDYSNLKIPHTLKCRQKLDKILILQQKIMLTMIKCTIFLRQCTSMLILIHFNTGTDQNKIEKACEEKICSMFFPS